MCRILFIFFQISFLDSVAKSSCSLNRDALVRLLNWQYVIFHFIQTLYPLIRGASVFYPFFFYTIFAMTMIKRICCHNNLTWRIWSCFSYRWIVDILYIFFSTILLKLCTSFWCTETGCSQFEKSLILLFDVSIYVIICYLNWMKSVTRRNFCFHSTRWMCF